MRCRLQARREDRVMRRRFGRRDLLQRNQPCARITPERVRLRLPVEVARRAREALGLVLRALVIGEDERKLPQDPLGAGSSLLKEVFDGQC